MRAPLRLGRATHRKRHVIHRLLLWPLSILLVALVTVAALWPAASTPVPATPQQELVPVRVAEAAPALAEEPPPLATADTLPTATGAPTPSAAPTATTSGIGEVPTPTARPAQVPWRVGLQIGHLRSEELPEELASLRTSTGTRWGDTTEAELNEQIVTLIKPLLEARGVVVDVIPATVPPAYDGDAFVAIHADGTNNQAARGWKLATPWRASAASKQLLNAVWSSYGPATGMPEDVGGVTVNMRGYYAFAYRRYEHAIARTTPALIVEMGFMTNAADRETLFGGQDAVARGIADGIMAYLAQRDRSDGAALLPPEFPPLQAKEGALLHAGPSDNAAVLAELSPGDQFSAFSLENGWYEGFVRGRGSRLIGFIRQDMVEPAPADEPTPAPPPPTNS